MAGLSKEELVKIVKEASQLTDEQVEQLAERVSKGTVMEEINEKIDKLTKVEDNKMQKIENDTKDDGPKWKSFGEQMQAVYTAVQPTGEVDKRLITSKSILGGNELVGAEGGFLVDPIYTKEILTIAHDVAVIAKDCRHLSIAGNRIIIKAVNETSRATGNRWGGIQVYWVAEGAEATAKEPNFRLVDLKLNKLMGINYATEELLADQNALQGITVQGFGEEFAFVIDDAVFSGTGAGMPLGLRNCNAFIEASAESGQDADTVVAENIASMWNRMPAKNRLKAKWYVIQDVEPQLFKMGYKMGTAAVPVFMPPAGQGGGGLVGSPNGTLFNRAIQTVEQCQTLGDSGDIMLLDLSQYLIIEKAGGLNVASSMHVEFKTDQQCFRFKYRLDGQPLWHNTITAFNSGVTRSPFVGLAAR